MSRLVRPILLIASGLALLVAVTALLWYVRERPVLYFTDADTIRRPVEAARLRDVLWRAPVHLDDGVNSGVDESEPAVSADGSLLLFSRGAPGGNADIMIAERTPAGWTTPRPLAAINSAADDLGPEPAPNGRAIYFYSNRGGGAGGYDLWVAERADDADGDWTLPRNLGPAVNSRHDEYGPALTPDGGELYFSSNRPRDAGATEPGDYDVYRVRLSVPGPAPADLGAAEPVTALNSPHHDGAPAVSPVGDFVYLGSDRPGGSGGFDLYRSRRVDGELRAPENLGTAVNTPANELDPAVGLGGFGLHFSSDRARVAPDGGEPPRDYDLYRTTSREVFAATEYMRAEIDWRSLVPYLGWLALALLVLLLLFILTRVVRSERYGKLSLLMRCLLASMITHVLLLVLLGFWGVGSSLADWAKRGDGMRVAIVSTAVGSDLSAQVRGSFTELLIDPAAESTERVAEAMPAPAPRLSATEIAVEAATIETAALPARTRAAVDAPPPAPAPTESTSPAHVAAAASVPIELPVAPGPSPQTEPALRVTVRSPPAPARSAPAETAAAPDASRDAPAVSLPPSTTAADPADARTLVADAAVSDARPPAEGAELSTSLARLAERPAPIQPELALPAGARARARSESAQPVTVRAVETARLDRPVDVASGAAATPEVEIAPEAAPDVRAGVGLMAVDNEATDAAPRPSLSVLPAPAGATPRPLAAVEVPPLPAASAARSGEIAAGVETNLPALTPVDTAALTPTPGPATGSTELEPLTTPPTPAATARASLVRAETADAAPAPNAPAISPREETSRPAPSALALPALEEEAAARATETALAVTAPPAPAAARRFTGANRADAPPVDRAMPLPAASAPSAPGATSLLAARPRATGASIPPADLPPMVVARVAGPSLDLDLEVPAMLPPSPQKQRAPERRKELVEKMGGSRETEEAVARALEWLARHQSADGHWDSDGFDDACGACGGETAMPVDVALTGLSLLCFFGTDYTHIKDSPYRDAVERGLTWLLARQSERGDLLAGESMYSHGIATLALAEAYGMTGDERLREPVERAVSFIVGARNRREGGWRYAPRQAGDTSVLGWQIMALSSARAAGIDVPAEGFAEARSWLGTVSRPEAPGLYAYQPDRPPSPAMTAESMFVLQLVGEGPDAPGMAESASYLLRHPPAWNEEASTYYWYYATLALFQHQDWMWNRWNEGIKNELLAHQATEGAAAGSWEPVDQWAQTGGRIYQTAICTLTLEVYYRYLPRFVRSAAH